MKFCPANIGWYSSQMTGAPEYDGQTTIIVIIRLGISHPREL